MSDPTVLPTCALILIPNDSALIIWARQLLNSPTNPSVSATKSNLVLLFSLSWLTWFLIDHCSSLLSTPNCSISSPGLSQTHAFFQHATCTGLLVPFTTQCCKLSLFLHVDVGALSHLCIWPWWIPFLEDGLMSKISPCFSLQYDEQLLPQPHLYDFSMCTQGCACQCWYSQAQALS